MGILSAADMSLEDLEVRSDSPVAHELATEDKTAFLFDNLGPA